MGDEPAESGDGAREPIPIERGYNPPPVAKVERPAPSPPAPRPSKPADRTAAPHRGFRPRPRTRVGRKPRAGTAVTLAMAAAILSSACAARSASPRTIDGLFEQTLPVGDDTLALDVRTGSGRILVSAGEPGVVRVTRRVHGHANRWTPDPPAVVEDRVRTIEADPPIEFHGDVLHVGHLDGSMHRQVSIDYELAVPENSRVRARTGSGSLRVEGVTGPVETTSGSGRTRVADVARGVTVEADSGDVELIAVTGGVDVRTGSGSIDVTGSSMTLRAETGSGRIQVEGTSGGAWILDAGSGDVSIDLPDDAGFEVDARTDSGTVRIHRPVPDPEERGRGELRGVVGGGGPRMTLRTGSGDVTIR